jgi:hypothetical protein
MVVVAGCQERAMPLMRLPMMLLRYCLSNAFWQDAGRNGDVNTFFVYWPLSICAFPANAVTCCL